MAWEGSPILRTYKLVSFCTDLTDLPDGTIISSPISIYLDKPSESFLGSQKSRWSISMSIINSLVLRLQATYSYKCDVILQVTKWCPQLKLHTFDVSVNARRFVLVLVYSRKFIDRSTLLEEIRYFCKLFIFHWTRNTPHSVMKCGEGEDSFIPSSR